MVVVKSVSVSCFYEVCGKCYIFMLDEIGYFEEGIVLWYGRKFYNYYIFNGEIYDMFVMIVVYKILLLFSFVWVINLDNGKFVIVCVNDCGLFYDDCIIDLFYFVVYKLDYYC